QGLDGGEDDGQVLRLAHGHDDVGGDLLDRGLPLPRGQHADDLARVAIRPRQTRTHARPGRRDDRQPVRPAALLVVVVDLLVAAGELEDLRGRPQAAHARVTAFSTDSMARSALRTTSSSRMPPSGCGTRASGRSAMPRFFASSRASASNSKVPMTAVGTPRCSSRMAPWILHDVHDPQSALPTRTKSHADSASRASGDGGPATGLSRLTISPTP